MFRKLLSMCVLLAALTLGSCIHNNIPYPRIQANFVTLEFQDQSGSTAIDTVTRTATVTLPEEADIYNVLVTGYSLSPGAELVGNPFADALDLSQPCMVDLRLYQDWQWKIVARQDIDRYFEVEGQMGETTIDVATRRVIVYVGAAEDLTEIKVVRAKLGPAGSEMTPALAEGSTFDATKPLKVTVENYDRAEEWTVYVEVIAELATTESADGWTRVAWVYGKAEATGESGVEYRVAGAEEWLRVPAADVTNTNGSIKACIKHLSPQTSYETRVYSGDDYGKTLTFKTGAEVELPNGNFENWWLDGKVWCPWTEGEAPFWGTGNPGAAMGGSSITVPTDDTPTGTGKAAKLETKNVLIKLAAGNIFTGDYVRTEGTNGVLSFGREFVERPVGLRGQFKYKCTPINKTSSEFSDMNGKPDTAIVWMALIDSPSPIEIRTNPANRNLFDENASYVVAYGKVQWAKDVEQYQQFKVDLDYRSTSRVPRYIIVCASASKYGDYFTGGVGSTLWIADFELEYDY
ncbi:MAG: PCMD domain-containing protein [Muribaculaceae bacterium]|nr:PCMD domain-containing protein [Muribaculaceae bacterium]